MSDSYGALCSDFYVNQRLNLKMDLPGNREAVLGMFDRVRREFPGMGRFKRMEQELALESDPGAEGPQRWLALRRNNVRSGVVSPGSPAEAYRFHRTMLEVAPYFLSISPLDVDYLELLFGFDLLASGNHDAIVFDALIAGTPLAQMLDAPGASVVDCQPVFGITLGERRDIEAHFEIKTRSAPPDAPGEQTAAPISIYLTMRRYGSVEDVAELPKVFDRLAKHGEELVQSRLLPNLLLPIREAIGSNNA
jgi:hypothetical protein